ncbi:MAG TPA: DUF2851 family protein [Planctomycetaceae bacterium]|nr:DUF2851 family protein [Planctomycetaceae bacterium]
MHVRASDWRRHGHHNDRHYNGVMFHVVSYGDDQAVSASGRQVPLVFLRREQTLAGMRSVAPANPVPDEVVAADLLPELTLEEAGDRRFLAKSSGFQVALRTRHPDDVLWAAVLDGLGYSRNRKGFRQLATRLPWSALAGVRDAGRALPPADIELVLLWAAGLAEKPPASSSPGAAAARLSPLPGPRPEWARAAGRPQNHPARRITAAAHLACRWQESGGPAASLESAVVAATRPVELDRSLAVFGSGPDRACLGPGRAGAIVVNAVLPGLHAIAFETGRWHLAERCLSLYRAHPKLPDNGVEREARTLLRQAGRAPAARNARDQQGLLYLYRALTTG